MKYTSRINNFVESINYLNEVQFFFSVTCIRRNGLKYKSTTLSRFLNVFWMVSAISMLFGGMAVKMSVQEFSQQLRDLSPILLLVASIELTLVCTTSLVTCISMIVHSRDHIDLINQFEAMDQLLKREFHSQIDYGRLVKKNYVLCSVFILYYCILCVGCTIQLAEGDYVLVIIILLCYVYLTMGSLASGYAHLNYVEVIENRFRLVNKLLETEYLVVKFPGHTERNSKIHILFQTYKDLYRQIESVNSIFGEGLSISLFHDFFQIISQLFIVLTFEKSIMQSFIFFGLILTPVYKTVTTPTYTSVAMNMVSVNFYCVFFRCS